MACGLQIVQVNDVYEIDNWPQYSSLRRRAEASFPHGPTIGVLPGDFVSPSLLSSLDRGLGMVDCMNAAGIDYVCIGNHESDIPLNALHDRIRQSRFVWLNSNIPDFPSTLPSGANPLPLMPEYKIIEVTSAADPAHTRRIGLIGLCSEDRSVMSKGAFGDCAISSLNETCKALVQKLVNEHKCDCVIPLTHQLVQQDRDLCELLPESLPVPFVLGGHDHEPFGEPVFVQGGATARTVVKTGADGKLIAVLSVVWASASTPSHLSETSLKMTPAADEPEPDLAVKALVESHKAVLKEIEASTLCAIPAQMRASFTSQGMRQRPTTVGTFVCTVLREALQVEAVLVGAGSIRGNRSYAAETDFSYAHLKAEIPFNTIITVVDLPGRVIAAMVCHTRAFALQKPPVEKGGYLQADDGLIWDAATNTVSQIGGELIDPDRVYNIGVSHGMLEGLDNVAPLLAFKVINCPPSLSLPSPPPPIFNPPLTPSTPPLALKSSAPPGHSVFKPSEAGFEAKHLVVSHFSQLLLFDVLKRSGGFAGLDKNGDDCLSKEELAAGLGGRSLAATRILVDNLFSCADKNGDGTITQSELQSFALSAMLKVKFGNSSEEAGGAAAAAAGAGLEADPLLSLEDLERELAEVAGGVFDESIRRALRSIDKDGSGFISKSEYAAVLKSQLAGEFAAKVNI